MHASIHRLADLTVKVIRYAGFVLFGLSFVAPPSVGNFHLFGGLMMFVQTPIIAFQFLTGNGNPAADQHVLLSVVMLAAWVVNFTVFTWMPRPAAVITILLPWVAYIYLFPGLGDMLPFYPWAIGIALIHLSRWSGPVYAVPKVAP